VAAVVRAHKKATDFMNNNPAEAKVIAANFSKLDPKIIDEAWPHIKYDYKLNAEATKTFIKEMISLGESGAMQPVIKAQDIPDADAFVSKLLDTSFLNK
jgi:ABC-type nitrate/sulfonate/bicarbonate transport system substrate-binding protein